MSNPHTNSGNSYSGTGAKWVSKEELRQIWRLLNNIRSPDGSVTISRSSGGLGLQAAAGSSLYPCKLTAKTNDTTYTGNIYANGTDATATETGVTIRVAGMATGATLPYAVWFHATKEKWSGVEAWTLVGVPRWL